METVIDLTPNFWAGLLPPASPRAVDGLEAIGEVLVALSDGAPVPQRSAAFLAQALRPCLDGDNDIAGRLGLRAPGRGRAHQAPATPSPATMDAAPLATLAQGIERLARAADAELTQWGPELTDLEPLRECLRVLPSSAPVPRLSVRTWVALADHAMAHDAAARHHPDQGRRVSPEELHELIRPGQGGGMHWMAAACDSEATRSVMLALDLEPESTGMDG